MLTYDQLSQEIIATKTKEEAVKQDYIEQLNVFLKQFAEYLFIPQDKIGFQRLSTNRTKEIIAELSKNTNPLEINFYGTHFAPSEEELKYVAYETRIFIFISDKNSVFITIEIKKIKEQYFIKQADCGEEWHSLTNTTKLNLHFFKAFVSAIDSSETFKNLPQNLSKYEFIKNKLMTIDKKELEIKQKMSTFISNLVAALQKHLSIPTGKIGLRKYDANEMNFQYLTELIPHKDEPSALSQDAFNVIQCNSGWWEVKIVMHITGYDLEIPICIDEENGKPIGYWISNHCDYGTTFNGIFTPNILQPFLDYLLQTQAIINKRTMILANIIKL